MPRFRVINPFRERNSRGDRTGRTIEPGATFDVNGVEMERLINAGCIVPMKEITAETQVRIPVETEIAATPEKAVTAPVERQVLRGKRHARTRR